MAMPTREDIIRVLKRSRGAATPRTLANLLGITKKEMTAFKRLLRGLKQEELVVRTGRSHLALPAARFRGEFLETGRAFGFVRPLSGSSDVFIQKWARAGARDGDIVEFDLTDPGRRAGRVVRIIERLPSALGILVRRSGGRAVLLPFRKNMEEVEITASPNDVENSIVRVAFNYGHGERTGRVVEVLGDIDTEGIGERVILEIHNRPVEFSAEALAEAESFPDRVPSSAIKNRKDYRNLLCFTIDPDDAKDYDDAVSLQPGHSPDTTILGVHIADVSHFVADGSALDVDARARSCSVYFPRGVVPMLPPRLCGDLCSLRAGVDRLTFSAMLEINRHGEVVGSEFHSSVIRSSARLTYTEAQAMIEGGEGPRGIRDALVVMKALSERMLDLRCRQGSLDFDLPEPLLHFDEDGELVHISPYPRLATHRLVEEFMLAANEAVARHLFQNGIPTLYRAHEAPDPEKVDELNDLLEIFHIPPITLPDPSPRDFQRAIDMCQKRVEEKFLVFKILRALMLARYSTVSLGHFGLAKEFYLHFTSPIRRYPDLVVHRALRVAIGEAPAISPPDDLDVLADATSRLERDANEIEREIVAWKIARFMRKHLGEIYDAMVIGFSAHHMMLELDGLYIEAKVRIDSLPGRWELDQGYTLRFGRKKKIKIGDQLKIQVASVDMRRRETVFLLAV